ncbi:HlyD family secretion protein [Alphaproteobacteria bacterium]|jgi:membrane fusion protein (multidrug efflux system)|nr:HlyD family secretion protein [Alphaproteobacteria bacterium]MDB2583315.1 HlyD family secretion protein [Alphaproteobacteria bacterium]
MQDMHVEKEKPDDNRLKRFLLLILLPSIIVLTTAGYFYSLGRFVKTENAYIKAPIVSVQSQLPGRVELVFVKDNQKVKKGQKLLKIETQKLELDLIEQEQNLLSIIKELENRKLKYNEAKEEIKLAREEIKFYFSEMERIKALVNIEIKVAKEKVEYQKLELDRIRNLVSKRVGLKSKLDEANYLYKSAVNNLKFVTLNNDLDEIKHSYVSSKQKLKIFEDKARSILTTLNGNEKINPFDHPLYKKHLSKLNQIKFDIKKSTIIADHEGIIAKMNIEVGEYINLGRMLFAIVDEKKAWVEANLKETELTHVKVGQSVIFVPDTFSKNSWQGQVESISPATGAEFSILPPQNSSGNWVKVVQRVPVRISIGKILEQNNEGFKINKELRMGMSVSVTIDTKHEGEVPFIIRPFANIFKFFEL